MRFMIPKRNFSRSRSASDLLGSMKFILAVMLFGLAAAPISLIAAETDLKPGEVIRSQNWQKIQGMVGENFFNRIKAGHKIQIKGPKVYRPLKEYIEATEKYSGKVRARRQWRTARLRIRTAVSKIRPGRSADRPETGLEFFLSLAGRRLQNRWSGQRWKNHTAGDRTGRLGAPRGSCFLLSFPQHALHVRIPSLRSRATSISTIYNSASTAIHATPLEPQPWRFVYKDPNRADDLYIYLPSIRRIRRATTTQRCQTLAPSEFNLDDINSFNGKITDFNYKYLGDKKILAKSSQEHLPFARKHGDYLPLDEKWEIVDTYVLEVTPKDPNYCYPRKVLHLNKVTFDTHWTLIWDKRGDYWKEQFGIFTPVKLADGREAWSVGDVIIVNVQNGRSTIVTATRAYNQGYPASMFSLATLQSVMRGGSIE